jgi:hypothetical protein
MRLRFNAYRAGLLLIILCLVIAWRWVCRHVDFGAVHLSVPYLDQKHTVAVAALVLIAIVGLAKMWIRRR